MPYELDLNQQYLSYVARFERPTFELWGLGGTIARGMYDAFLPFGVPLSNFQLSAAMPTASEPIVAVKLGEVGTCKFAYDRIECMFVNFSEEVFGTIPKVLAASTSWIYSAVPSFKIVNHTLMWYSHSMLKQGSGAQYLQQLNPKRLSSGGTNLGTGSIFNFLETSRQWQTQLMLDNSTVLHDALFVSLTISTKADRIDYDKIVTEGREYFRSLLQELDLKLPEPSR